MCERDISPPRHLLSYSEVVHIRHRLGLISTIILSGVKLSPGRPSERHDSRTQKPSEF